MLHAAAGFKIYVMTIWTSATRAETVTRSDHQFPDDELQGGRVEPGDVLDVQLDGFSITEAVEP